MQKTNKQKQIIHMKKAEERIDRNVDKINKKEDTCVNNKMNNNLEISENINRSSVNPSKCGFLSH